MAYKCGGRISAVRHGRLSARWDARRIGMGPRNFSARAHARRRAHRPRMSFGGANVSAIALFLPNALTLYISLSANEITSSAVAGALGKKSQPDAEGYGPAMPGHFRVQFGAQLFNQIARAELVRIGRYRAGSSFPAIKFTLLDVECRGLASYATWTLKQRSRSIRRKPYK